MEHPKISDAQYKNARASQIMASLLRDRGLLFYGAATLLGAPVWLWKKWRLKRYLNLDCEFDPARWTLRFPDKLNAQPQTVREAHGPRVMFFTQGWGEVETMKPLIRALREKRPDARLIFTAKHHEAIGPASQWSDEEIYPLPFDNALSVARWLERARPDVVIFYERFFYATLLRSLWMRRVPFVILHARMRRTPSRSAPNVAFKKWQLRGLSEITLSSPDYRPGVEQLVAPETRVHIVGSLKFLPAPPPIEPQREADLRAWIEAATAGAPLLVAGSTHETEEEFVLDAFEKVRQNCAGQAPTLLIAPRKPTRADDVAASIERRGLSFARRSQTAQPPQKVDVLLLDTLGELGTAYGWAQSAFVGGTLIGNSQNVAEPLIWSIPVAFGPRKGNFETEQRLCEEAGVGFRVATPDELAAHWGEIIQSPQLREELGRKVKALVDAQSSAFERTLQVLLDAVDTVSDR